MEWPIYFRDNLVIGNLESEVGVCTLWTEMHKEVLPHVNPRSFAVMGQLYSMNTGLSAIVRNLSANRSIRHLVVTGKQVATRTGEALVGLFENGIDENHKVVGVNGAELESEIPIEAVNKIRTNVKLHDLRDRQDYTTLDSLLSSLHKRGSYGEPEIFPKTEIKPPERYSHEGSAYVIREKYVADAWLRILDTIMKFGVVKKSSYGEDQREILNLTAVISAEDPDNIRTRPFLQFPIEDIKRYLPEMTDDVPLEGTDYKYGNRFRSYFGVDQIQYMIDDLKKESFSRRAVASTLDIPSDYERKAPCINIVQALMQDDRLHLTAFIRSNEMFDGWPLNAYGLRKLQKIISEETGIEMGTLTSISGSAHLYAPRWSDAMRILNAYPRRLRMIPDPRGNFIIELEDGRIKATHQSPEGTPLGEIYGENARDLIKNLIVEGRISQIDHAGDMGMELQKAEIALTKGIPYTQDQNLNL